MTDRELLELAAKAAGAEAAGLRGREPIYSMPTETDEGTEYARWNPLEDDGDCARMESALWIDVLWAHDYVQSDIAGIRFTAKFADHGGDRNRARRWASVHIAAFCQKARNRAAGVMP